MDSAEHRAAITQLQPGEQANRRAHTEGQRPVNPQEAVQPTLALAQLQFSHFLQDLYVDYSLHVHRVSLRSVSPEEPRAEHCEGLLSM